MSENIYINKFFIAVCKCFILFFAFNIPNYDFEIRILSNKIIFSNQYNFSNISSIYELLNDNNITKNKVLLFESFPYHYECTPGFAKYFIDLGFNVDIIMHDSGISSFYFFEDINKIRFFIFNDIRDIEKYANYLGNKLLNYNYALIETAVPIIFPLYKSLKLININHSFFVFHHLEYLKDFSKYVELKKKQLWSLGNFKDWIQVNPHYFGNIHVKQKNLITRFFITSTIERNYEYVISSFEEIRDDNLEFHVNVIGKWNTFTQHNISEKVKDNFSFKYNVSYSELYNVVNETDFIIINLEPHNIKDDEFAKTRVSGSIQLAYGFLKPVIINKKFAAIYKFNSDNSFITNNCNLTEVMRKAINLSNKQYQKMKQNLKRTANYIYKNSLKNVNDCIYKS